MSSTRQLKYGGIIRKDLSEIFQRDSKNWFGKTFITVTEVQVTPDLAYAKVFISLMLVPNKDAVMEKIEAHNKDLRRTLGNKIGKQVRVVPELTFVLDETADDAQKMDDLLAGLNIPPEDKED